MKLLATPLRAMGILLLSCVSISLVSFTVKPGGEGFEVYLNNKVVIQQFGTKMNEIKSLQIDPSSADQILSVRYHHCGKIGKDRRIVIKDAQDKIVKEWKFKDVENVAASMSCPVKEIISLQKKMPMQLKLFYSSTELPKGRQLAALTVRTSSTAKL